MQEETPLELLLGAYLNEDVFDVYPDVMGGVDDFCRREPQLVAELGHEIDAALNSLDDAALDTYVRGLGIGFIPGDRGYRSWLRQIADRARAVQTAGG